MAQRVQRPLKAFFITNFKPTLEEARKVYSFFASKGELIEFKFARDPEIKKIKNFGWMSYKDNKITEELFENWFKIEPYNTEVIVQRADKEAKKSITKPPRASRFSFFEGFHLKDDAPSSSPVLDQINYKFTSTSDNNDKSQLHSSDTGQENGNIIIEEKTNAYSVVNNESNADAAQNPSDNV
ncbi:9459_t:CDS:2 [Funneliformis geosporum]|uniref:3285_t:CDS:1 n=1 Tax=Funneliformis geosporum TaxID=1117311 RepID=A0A9W4SGK4_9GLOM|nr:3285_t:CDS:2 [Funneliformis geosporum]CAI2190563.1 9459_t:CDS:2 [Funneliformis geosporum]